MHVSDQLIGDLAKQIFKDHSATLPLHDSTKDDELDHELLRLLAESGFAMALAASEDVTVRDTVNILHSAGYYAARVPLAEMMLAHWLASRVAWHKETALPLVAVGGEPEITVAGSRRACVVSGLLTGVPWGRHATAIYTLVGTDLVRIPAQSARVVNAENLAGAPRDTMAFYGVAGQSFDVAIEPDEVFGRAALLRAALMVGAMERALDLALEHASTRVQFGKPIGRFQAVQQLLAQLGSHVAAAAAAVDCGAAHGSLFTAAVAKSRAGEAAGLACEIAHQVVATMGFTREHPLHLVTRRLWAWRDECGNETYWNSRVGETILATGGEGMWALLTATGGGPSLLPHRR